MLRRHAALGDFADRLCGENDLIAGRQIERVGKAVEHVLALSRWLFSLAPVDGASPTQNDKRGFFRVCTGAEGRRRAANDGQKSSSTPSRLSGEVDREVCLPAAARCKGKGPGPCCRSNHLRQIRRMFQSNRFETMTNTSGLSTPCRADEKEVKTLRSQRIFKNLTCL